MSGGDINLIREGLRQNIISLAQHFLPGGRIDRHLYHSRSSKPDKTDGSTKIDIAGPTAGRWVDFADDAAKGDAIDFIAFHQFGCYPPDGRKEAIAWARNWLGLSDEKRRADIARAAAQAPKPAPAPAFDADKARRAKGWWLRAEPLAGTLAERYLIARGVDFSRLNATPHALRFCPEMKHRSGGAYPGMLGAMCDGYGAIVAVHRTFLDPETGGKAPVSPAKMLWGPGRAASVRLSKGASRLSPEQAARKGVRDETQVILEGIEDGLIWAMLYPDHRVTAAYSVSNMANAPLFECCKRIIIVGDNDAPGTPAAKALGAACDAIKRRAGAGRIVDLIKPKGAKDINALWESAA